MLPHEDTFRKLTQNPSPSYLKTHMPLVEDTWKTKGLQHWQVVQIGPQADGSKSPYQVQALLTFESLAAFQAAGEQDGPKIFGDIPNFTDTQPLLLAGDEIAKMK